MLLPLSLSSSLLLFLSKKKNLTDRRRHRRVVLQGTVHKDPLRRFSPRSLRSSSCCIGPLPSAGTPRGVREKGDSRWRETECFRCRGRVQRDPRQLGRIGADVQGAVGKGDDSSREAHEEEGGDESRRCCCCCCCCSWFVFSSAFSFPFLPPPQQLQRRPHRLERRVSGTREQASCCPGAKHHRREVDRSVWDPFAPFGPFASLWKQELGRGGQRHPLVPPRRRELFGVPPRELSDLFGGERIDDFAFREASEEADVRRKSFELLFFFFGDSAAAAAAAVVPLVVVVVSAIGGGRRRRRRSAPILCSLLLTTQEPASELPRERSDRNPRTQKHGQTQPPLGERGSCLKDARVPRFVQ